MARPNDPPLQPSDVVDAAKAMIDREGLAGFSIRKLAREMGIAAPTLYYHFKDKDELLRHVGEAIVAGMRQSKAPADPLDAIVVHALDYYRMFVEHPAAAHLIGYEFRRSHALRWYEYLVGLIEASGIPLRDAVSFIEALDGLLQGMAAATASGIANPDIAAFRRSDLGDFPKLRRAVKADRSTELARVERAVRALLKGWVTTGLEGAAGRRAQPRKNAQRSKASV